MEEPVLKEKPAALQPKETQTQAQAGGVLKTT